MGATTVMSRSEWTVDEKSNDRKTLNRAQTSGLGN